MKVKLVVKDEDGGGAVVRWERVVEREYAGVPRVGDWVFLDEGRIAAHPVTHVVWDNDGTAALGFQLRGSGDFLASLGFARRE